MVAFLLSHEAQAGLFDGEGKLLINSDVHSFKNWQIGYASIHLASMFGYTDIVAYLIAKGQDVDLLDKHDMTPLMHAVSNIRNRDPTQLLVR